MKNNNARIPIPFVLLLLSAGLLAAGQRETSRTTRAGDFVPEATIRSTHAAFAAGQVTCVQLVQAYLNRIRAFDDTGPALNAIITINPRALETAADMDRSYAANRSSLRPLHCIPVILKDNYDTADMPTTGGSLTLAESVPLQDAFVVKKLREGRRDCRRLRDHRHRQRHGTIHSVAGLGAKPRRLATNARAGQPKRNHSGELNTR